MRRLEKNQISELRKTMPILDGQELQSFIGGDGKKYYFNDSGQLDKKRTESYECSGTFDTIVVNGCEVELKGTVNIDKDGIVSFPGDAALFEFLANNTSAEYAYAYNSGEETGVICTSGEEQSVKTPDSWKTYDNCAHNHNANIKGDITEEQKDEVNGLPSQADIEDLKSTNAQRKRQGLPPQTGLIYNERTGQWQEFDEKTQTIEDYIDDLNI